MAFSKTTASSLLIAGIGVGSVIDNTIEPSLEVTPELDCKTNKVRFEEAHHKADKSILEALSLGPETTNQKIIDLFTELSKANKKLKSKSSAVSDYYKRNGG